MKSLMLTSEAVPFIKSGGLADVVTALSHALIHLGHDVRMILPAYKDIDLSQAETLPLVLSLDMGDTEEKVRVKRLELDDLQCIFFDTPSFSERCGIYGESSHTPYPDNLYRYTVYAKAVFEYCRHTSWYPDIYHCHDWTCGLIPALLKQQQSMGFRDAKSIITIHNLGYQGDYSKHDIHLLGIDPDALNAQDEQSGYLGRLNLLRIGISNADIITTVSPTYAKEIMTKEMGHGMHELLFERKDDLYGILNGVDYHEWNPESDSLIPYQYSSSDITPKALNKKELQQYCGLDQEPDTLLIGMVSRIADQKGFRELCSGSPSALERILMELPVQIVIVGTGDSEIETFLQKIDRLYDNFTAKIVFNNYIAHLVEAGSDMFLMPSRYEPCGLNQIYSLRFGTLPIVRHTGGLADTVEAMSPDGSTGTGFIFEEMSGEAIYDSVVDSLNYWDLPKAVKEQVIVRAMEQRFTWTDSAVTYDEIYKKIGSKGENS